MKHLSRGQRFVVFYVAGKYQLAFARLLILFSKK